MAFFDAPAEWRLDQAGWRRKVIDNKELASLLGDAFHHCHAEYYRAGAPEVTPQVIADLGGQARYIVEGGLAEWKDQKFEVSPKAQSLYAALPMKAQFIVHRWLEGNKVPRIWPVEAVELYLPDYGYCKLDLVLRLPSSRLGVLDAKIKLRLEKKWASQELDKFAYSWQFLHYAWAAMKHFEEKPVDYLVMMVVLEPTFHIYLEHYNINYELLQLWENSAKAAWAVMSAMEGDWTDLLALKEKPLFPWHGFDWFTRYGRREYTNAFLRHRLHDHLMEEEYINIKKYTDLREVADGDTEY